MGKPSTTSLYARDWSASGVGLLPAPNDEFMIVNQKNSEYVTMTLKKWCAGAKWWESEMSLNAVDKVDTQALDRVLSSVALEPISATCTSTAAHTLATATLARAT